MSSVSRVLGELGSRESGERVACYTFSLTGDASGDASASTSELEETLAKRAGRVVAARIVAGTPAPDLNWDVVAKDGNGQIDLLKANGANLAVDEDTSLYPVDLGGGAPFVGDITVTAAQMGSDGDEVATVYLYVEFASV